MKNLRKKLNDFTRKTGNKLYDGLGDVLTEEVSPRNIAAIAAVTFLPYTMIGCGPDVVKLTDKVYDAQMNIEREVTKSKLGTEFNTAIDNTDRYFDSKTDGLSPEAKKIKDLEVKRDELKRNLTNSLNSLEDVPLLHTLLS